MSSSCWAMVVGVVTCAAGCGRPAVEPARQVRSEAVSADETLGLDLTTQDESAFRVEPGALLVEADFKSV